MGGDRGTAYDVNTTTNVGHDFDSGTMVGHDGK